MADIMSGVVTRALSGGRYKVRSRGKVYTVKGQGHSLNVGSSCIVNRSGNGWVVVGSGKTKRRSTTTVTVTG
jgi:hypothetical protein